MTYLGVGCLGIAALLYVAFRFTGRAEPAPGDDTAFTLLMLVPIALLAGTLFSAIAWLRRDGTARLAGFALIVNGGLLVVLVALAVFGIASYTGR